MYDFIGDIHGHADELKRLLKKLGYEKKDGVYNHPERTAFFLGDFIDRGPFIPESVNLVRDMVESGSAKAIMGNHEYNAILYEAGLRLRTRKNNNQHKETLMQYADNPEDYLSTICTPAYKAAIEWFKTLPLFYEDENVRAIHACWHQPSIEVIKSVTNNALLSENDIHDAADTTQSLHDAVENCLKGIETHLPNNISFKDKDGHTRHAMRIKWWNDPTNKTLKEMSVLDDIELPKQLFETLFEHYSSDERPVFFGHYWLKGTPALQKKNVCCLDYSVARNGSLCAYRFDGERELIADKLVWV